MKKLAIAMALASTAMAAPALARDGALYVGVEGGPMIVEDIDLDIGTNNDAASIDSEYGYDAAGIIGYDFGAFRAEAEISYRRAAADEITASVPGIPPRGTGGRLFTGQTDVNGYNSSLAAMINGMFDFGDEDGLQGFVGGGAGVARTRLRTTITNPSFLSAEDTGFAWQAIAGVRAPLSYNFDVGLKYRFFNHDNVEFSDALRRNIETRFRSHSILGSLIYNFGSPAVIIPPVIIAPPPPVIIAPPPPAIVCTPGPYIVFFDWDRSDITADAASTLDNAVSAYNSGCSGTQVMLAGHADRSGSADYNVGLSQRRNEAVRGYLTSRGIADSTITTEAFGESRPRVDTLDGVRNDQNRRVEITYGPGSGM